MWSAPNKNLRPVYKMATRKAYFKSVSQEQVDADQASAILSLGSRISAVETGKADASAVAGKADQSYVDSAVGAVDTKVDAKLDTSVANATYATAISVMSKAEQTYVDGALLSKANASDLQSIQDTIGTVQNSVQSQQLLLNGKVDTSTYTQRVAAENAFITALKDVLYIESSAGSNTEYDYTGLGLSA